MANQQILEFKCPCCSGIIEFDSGLQQMKCPYCETTFDPSALLEMDEALNNQQPDHMEWETPQEQFDDAEISNMNVYSCRSCGGEIIADATTGATHCPFCGNPVVLTEEGADCYNMLNGVIYYNTINTDSPALMRRNADGSTNLIFDGNCTDIQMTSTYTYFREYGTEVPVYVTPTVGSVSVKPFTGAQEAAKKFISEGK